MFDKNILPTGESHLHMPIEDCPCKPMVKRVGNQLALWHNAFDHREVWMGVEVMLEFICPQHKLFIDREQWWAGNHVHIPLPEPDFEYEHEKIDPR